LRRPVAHSGGLTLAPSELFAFDDRLQPMAKGASSSSLIKGIGSAWAVSIAGTATSLFLAPFALKRLGSEEYAVFLLATDTLLWLTLLDVGITGALTAKISKFGSGESLERDRLVSTAFVAQGAIAAVVLLLGGALTLWFDDLFPMPPSSLAAAKWTMASLAVAAAITAACKSYQSLLFANRRVHQYQLLSLGLILLRAGFIAGGLSVDWGLKSMGVGTLGATILFAAATSWVTRLELPLVRFRWALADRATLALITRTGIWFCLNSLAVIALRTLDRMVTAKVIGLAMVTPLALTNRIYELAQTNLAQISNTTWPVLAGQLGRGETSEARSLWRTTTQFSFVMAFLAGACLWAGNGAFISRWVGEPNYTGLLVDSILVANMVALTVIASFRAALTAAQKMRPQAIWRISEATAFVGLAVWLGPSQGLRGIVFAKLVSTLVGSVPWMGAATAGTLGLPTSELLKEAAMMLFRLSLCTIPAGLAGRWVADQMGGYLGAGTGTLAALLLASGPLLIWGIDQPTRNYLSARLGRIPWIGSTLKGIIARVSQPSVVPTA